MAFLSLGQEQYEALIALARRGTTTPEEARMLEAFLVDLETTNGITRRLLWVQWQEMNQPLPPGTDFPGTWPPELRCRIDLISRPITRGDVDAALAARARQPEPTSILVTPDPGALVGWTKIGNYFLT